MAIKYLSGKRATALKSDILSDSLGSSADGSNTGISQELGKLGGVNQGYAGGTHVGAGTYGAAGGGGAGAVGEPDTSSKSGNGGAGKANPITGSEVGELSSGVYYLAGGGGGGSHTGGTNSRGLGGLGGGGNGGDGSNSPENGTANTGGGAGGDTTGGSTNGMTGGTGVVIITYQTSEITSASGGTLESGSSIPSGYAIRKFTSSGTFQISAGSGNVQYVVVAGGGGSGSQVGGGGGAGGFLTGTKSMSSGSYTVTIGAGGTGANTDTSTRATNGANSVFDDVTTLGGGFGADNDITPYKNGNDGGSGGGGTYRSGAEAGGSGKQTGAYGFDGNDYVEVNGLKTIFNGATKLSVAGWIYPRDNVDETLLGQWNGSGDSDKVLDFHINGSNKLELSLRDGSTNYITTSSTSINENEWQHVAMTYDGATTTVKLYVNGTLDVTDTSNPSSLHTGTGSPALFGIYGDKSSNGFDGILDDWGVWSRILTATEIEKLTNNNDDGSTGWTFKTGGTASYEVSGGKIKLSPDNSGTTTGNAKASVATYDIYSELGNSNLANTWVLRATVDTVFNISGNDAGMVWNVGCCDSPASTFTTNQDENGTVQSIQGLRGGTGNSGGYQYHLITSWQPSQSDSNSTGSLSTNTNETKYIEVIRTSVSSASVKIYSNSDYSDTPTTISISSFTQNPANLRYIFARAHQKKSTVANYGRVYDIKLWNNTTTASGDPTVTVSLDEGDAQLVSSLTNKVNLKANYTMDSATVFTTQSSGSDGRGIFNGQPRVRLGQEFLTGHELIGKEIRVVKFWLKKVGSPTGTAYCRVRDSSDNIKATIGTLDVSTLTTSYAKTAMFGSGSATISNTDKVTFEFSGGSTNTEVQMETSASDVVSNSVAYQYATSWASISPTDLKYEISEGCKNDYSADSPITNLPAGSIMEATDNGKHYIWNATTSTWTEVA